MSTNCANKILHAMTVVLFSIALAIALAACGGGSGSLSPANTPAGTNPTPIVAVGPVTGFGSVFINGVRFQTSGASITHDALPASEGDLAVGYIVTLVGKVNSDELNGTASEIDYDEELEGQVNSIDLPNNRFVVLGQTVLVDAMTFFDDDIIPPSLDGLALGDSVEVHGYVTADFEILATRIELEDSSTEFEVTGIIENLDPGGLQFNINSLYVDYSIAMIDDCPGSMLQDGLLVEVEGDSTGPAGELIAREIECKDDDDLPGDDDDLVEIDGLITRFVSTTDFDVARFPVTTNGQTEYENGTAADLALNVHVEVDGNRNADGVLVAREIEFDRDDDDDIKIEAQVESIDAVNNQLTVLGTITVRITTTTMLEDDRDDMRPFSIDNINVGDFVEIRGFEDPPGSHIVVAVRLERDEDDNEVELQGAVESVTEPDFVILGVAVHTDAGTEFENDADSPIQPADFFANAVGQLVKAEGQWNGSVLFADEVEFEREDD